MLKDFLEEVINLTVGKQSEEIVKLLNSKKHVNEFILAKKLDLTINQTRNILYKISDHGLVSSIRKKDKKKGWYTYFWKIEILKALQFLKSHLVKRVSLMERQLKNRESNRFYICKRCHIEMDEENAMLQDFVCPECGSILELKDDTKTLKDIEKVLTRTKKQLELVEAEIVIESEKLEKIRIRDFKREEAIKKKKRAESRAKRKKESKKTTKKSPKKKSSTSAKGRTVKKAVKKPTTKKTPKKKTASKVKKVTKKTAKAGTSKRMVKKKSPSKKKTKKKSR